MKKVLIVTYYWPPSGGGGVQRWLKFAKYLPEFGWEPVVYTPSNPQFENKDESLLKDVGDHVKVFNLPISEPYNLFKRLFFFKKSSFKQGVVSEKKKKSILNFIISWIRGNYFVPDPRVSWVKPSIEYLGKVIQDEQISIVVTTGPPHSMHLIGKGLKKLHDIKWIADFRDPWSDWDILDLFHLTKKSRNIHNKLEREVILNSDVVLTVSDSWAKRLEEKYNKKVKVITNGYDVDDFVNFTHQPEKEFRLFHGGLINNYRNTEGLWKVIEELLIENTQFNSSFKLVFAGNINHEVISQISKYPLLSDRIIVLGYIQHEQLIQEYSRASALLLLQNVSKNSKGHIPAKFFEYIGTAIPVLAIGDEQSDLAKLLEMHNPLAICRPEDEEKMKESMRYIFNAYQKATACRPKEDSFVFSRKNLTASLVRILNKL